MKGMMKLIVAGVGPGDPGLTTGAALKAAREAGLILAPCSHEGRPSVAGEVLRANLPGLELTPLLFPMIQDAGRRDAALRGQLEALRPRWEGAGTVLLPVIGDSALYATGAYLYEVWRELAQDSGLALELELIPGVSAHSLAASCARRFLALGEEVLCVIPGTAPRERVEAALCAADAAAVYKPSALKDGLRDIVMGAGPWGETVRVDRAGLPGERILRGDAALDQADEYLSLLLLWRGRG